MSRQAVYQITIDGTDVSSNFNPVLISLGITLYDGGQADAVEIELDDTGGQIALPRVGAPVSISLGWSDSGAAPIFDGFTDEPKSTARHHSLRHGYGQEESSGSIGELLSAGSRSRGRILTLSAKSANMGGKLKQPQQAHVDNTSFGTVAQQWGQVAGLSDVKVDASLSSVQRPYWAISNESFMAWGVRIAREIGATFKVLGSRAVFLPLAGGTSASGASLEGITAAWGVNLLDWSITPLQSRPSYANFKVRHYDPKAAQWKTEQAPAVGGIGSDFVADHTAVRKAASQDLAKAQAASNAAVGAREKGAADHVVIDGEPVAQPEAPCAVSGIRAGVDGGYTIAKVRHELRRGSGFTTQLGLKQPSGSAGVDSRT